MNFFHLHIHNLSIFVKFHRKPIRFMVYVKRQKLSCEIGNSIRLRLHMLPLPKKHISKCLKKLTIFSFTYSQSKHICKVSTKTDTFCGPLFLAPRYYLFYTRHMTRQFVVHRPYGHAAREDVRADFLFQFF
jgi:hypothetical protein